MSRDRNLWDEFAAKNAESYILTEDGADHSTEEGRRRFFESGERLTEELLANAAAHLRGRERAVEIGCGVGRLTLPHARRFGEVHAVDVSPRMLAKLEENAAACGLANIRTFLPEAAWDAPESCDYAYSFIVFQHIERWEEIGEYIHRLARALRPGGIAQLQFDARPRTLAYSVRNRLPDLALPRTWRRGIRRIRRKPAELAALFAREGLAVIREINPGTELQIDLLERR